jgi:hypothetical protein
MLFVVLGSADFCVTARDLTCRENDRELHHPNLLALVCDEASDRGAMWENSRRVALVFLGEAIGTPEASHGRPFYIETT